MSDPIIIVSGLPRCGTSLMMQILEAGGVQALTDGVREADHDNPRGYFEWEAIKQVGKDHRVLEPAATGGKAVKAISTLLPKLPRAYDYKVLFMQRDIAEVVISQQKMLASRGDYRANGPVNQADEQTKLQLQAHNDQIIDWMKSAPHIEFVFVQHRNLVENTSNEIARIREFIGRDRLPNRTAMIRAVDPSLYRNKVRNGIMDKLNSWLR